MEAEFKKIILEVRSMQIAKSYLKNIKKAKEEYDSRLNIISKEIEKCLDKHEKLEKLSLLAIYNRLTGSRTDLLEITKERFLTLTLEYNELKKIIDKTEYEISILSNKLENYDEVKFRFKKYLNSNDIDSTSNKIDKIKDIFSKIEFNLGLIKEIEEAINAGGLVNQECRLAINFVETEASRFDQMEGNEIIEILELNSIDVVKYQELIVGVKHELAKFESELNDVYSNIFDNKNYSFKLSHNFLTEYRQNLITDWKLKTSLHNSHEYLTSTKAVILGLTKSLRKDLVKLKSELILLEKNEEKILNMI